MAGDLDVLVKFTADSSAVQEEVGKVEKTGSKMSGWAKGVGAAIGGAFAVGQIKEFISSASELQDQMGATEQLFGSAAKSVQTWAEGAADAMGMATSEALAGANTMATFGKAAGLTGDELGGFSTDLVGLAGDLASFRGTTPEEAVLALGGALRGETEGIRAYGVMLDEGTIKARALSMGLVQATGDAEQIAKAQLSAQKAQISYNKAVEKYGEGSTEASIAGQAFMLAQQEVGQATAGTVPDLTQQQKILATQAEVFAQTSDAQGDFARTSTSAANEQKKLAADMENAKTALGTALLPAVQAILPIVQKLAEYIQENSSVIVPLVAAFAALAAVVWVVNAAMAANPVVLVIAGFIALIAAAYLVWKNWDKIWTWIMEHKAFAALLLVFAPIIAQFVLTVGALKFLWNNWDTIWDWITEKVATAVNAIMVVVGPIAEAIGVVFGKVKTAIQINVDLIRGYINLWIDAFVLVKTAATEMWQWVSDKVGALAGIISGAVSGIQTAVGRVVSAIKGPINAVIRAWNAMEFKIPEVSFFGKSFGGQKFDLPQLPELARGGVVSRTGLAVVHEGEQFSGVGRTFGNTFNVNVQVGPGTDPSRVGRTVVDYIRAYERANGTDWRTG